MKRQGLITSIEELRKIANKLEFQNGGYPCFKTEDLNKCKFQLNIINKKGLSDTWEFENV